MKVCWLTTDDDGTMEGQALFSVGSPASVVPAGEIVLTTRMSVSFDDGREFTMISGVAPTGATTVILDGPGVEPTTAFVDHGRFTAWWPMAKVFPSGLVQAYDGNGKQLASLRSLTPISGETSFVAS